MNKDTNWRLVLGAAFLMATSAIGPGFLMQTTVFTEQLATSFSFAILIAMIISTVAQLNIWRIIAVAEKKAQDIANLCLPGLGYCIAFLIFMGGLVFNAGNIGGGALGLNVVFAMPLEIGAMISVAFALTIFLLKDTERMIDYLMVILGSLMICLTLYVFIASSPPIVQAAKEAILPEKIDFIVIVTLVGGTVGGYITYAGGHRLLDAGIKGKESLPAVNKSALSALGIASLMRVLFFLATLGVISQGFTLNPENPPASVFQLAAGIIGYKFFGIVMWCAAITSIIGASYTSVSFISTFHPWLEKNHKLITILFIITSGLGFLSVGQPVDILIYAGAFNGLILPITLGVMLIAAYKSNVVANYRHPLWLTISGVIVVVIMIYMASHTLLSLFPGNSSV